MIHPERRRENLKKIEEMDREKVIKGLEETEIRLKQAVDRGGEMAVMGAFKCLNCVTDALAMLKEQEAVMPNVSSVNQRCGNCNKVIEMDGWKTCPWCGKPIDWARWWRENTNGVRHDG